jgi:hypothetical protein
MLMCVIVFAAISTAPAHAQNGQGVDVFCKDSPQDNGSTPSLGNHWTSPDIWIRNIPDGLTTHQNPIFNTINYIYVRVHNLGYSTANATVVKVYWADPACGIPWPTDWNYIGQSTITNLGNSSDAVIAALPWIPSGTALGHRCLLVRLECVQDGITHEGDVKNDNNIAQKNIQIIQLLPGHSLPIEIGFFLHNYPGAQMNLHVEAIPVNTRQNIKKQITRPGIPFNVELNMPDMEKYLEISAFKYQENNGRFLKKLPGKTMNSFILQEKSGKISGIQLKHSKVLNQLRISPTRPLEPGSTYEVTITQEVNKIIVGGLTYIISAADNIHKKPIK